MKIPRGEIRPTPMTYAHPPSHSHTSTRRAYSSALASVVMGSLMLDSKGSILSCTDTVAHLCGMEVDDMTDQPVKSLLPEVPIDPGTEGYNVAYVSFFAATGRVGSWSLLTSNSGPVQVEGCFTLLKIEARYLFRLELRWTDNQGAAMVRGIRRNPAAGARETRPGRRGPKSHH
jgi:hypothetical protein